MEGWRTMFIARKKFFDVRLMVGLRLTLLQMYVQHVSGSLGQKRSKFWYVDGMPAPVV